jgi:peptidoglycan-associated lipoprotein
MVALDSAIARYMIDPWPERQNARVVVSGSGGTKIGNREERGAKTTRKREMRTIKALAALAILALMAACSNNEAAIPASTTVTPGSIADFRQNVGDRVYFDTDMSSIRPDGRATLDKQAAWLKQYSNYQITIEGHCDERGTREYNFALGERRATAVRQYLVAQGLPADRIKTISYGKERPEVVGSDEGAWARNRRGVTTLQ